MFPYLKEGDIVFFKNYKGDKSELKTGKIVIFKHPLKNKSLIKRINFVNKNNIEVHGDNIELAQAEELMNYVEKIHNIFWASKGRSDAFVKAS